MTDEERDYLLNTSKRLYFELGAYQAFFEYAKRNQVGPKTAEGILNQCRADPELQSFVDTYYAALRTALEQGGTSAASQVVDEFFRQLTGKSRPS